MNLARFVVLASIVAASIASAEPLSPKTRATLDAFVGAEMQRENVPGVAVAIVRGGEVLVAQGYGLANVEHGVRVTPETVFESGSVGKQFTSAALMTLVEEGKVALNDSITKYLTDAPESWRPITVRHLLTHTSGIPDYTVESFDLRKDYTEDELAKMAYGLKLEFEPGARWSYSNTGFVLLGILMHKASGRFYGEILKERLFDPLGMKTARMISEADIVPNRAAGYRLVDGEIKNQEWVAPTLNTTADGSLYLSLRDYIAWDLGLRAKAVLKSQSWSQVYTPVSLRSGKPYPYGFGWFVDQSNGKPWYYHGGAWQGFTTAISRYLGDDLTVVVLTNSADADPYKFVDGIATIFDAQVAKLRPTQPIPDSEPAVAERVKKLLVLAAEGKLVPEDLAHIRAGFFPEGAKYYKDMLGPLGAPKQLSLLERRQLGDDQSNRYAALYGDKTYFVRVDFGPDGKVSNFAVQAP